MPIAQQWQHAWAAKQAENQRCVIKCRCVEPHRLVHHQTTLYLVKHIYLNAAWYYWYRDILSETKITVHKKVLWPEWSYDTVQCMAAHGHTGNAVDREEISSKMWMIAKHHKLVRDTSSVDVTFDICPLPQTDTRRHYNVSLAEAYHFVQYWWTLIDPTPHATPETWHIISTVLHLRPVT